MFRREHPHHEIISVAASGHGRRRQIGEAILRLYPVQQRSTTVASGSGIILLGNPGSQLIAEECHSPCLRQDGVGLQVHTSPIVVRVLERLSFSTTELCSANIQVSTTNFGFRVV